MNPYKIGIIGLGNLGKSVYNMLSNNGLKNFINISDKVHEEGYEYVNMMENVKDSDTIFMSVKPNDIKSVCKNMKGLVDNKIIISTAAGVPIDYIENIIGNKTKIIRCMPNIPISERKGLLVWYSKEEVPKNVKFILHTITEGPDKIWVYDEKLIDIATVLSGSNPAFQAYIAQAYIDFGIRNGFNAKESLKLYQSSTEGTSFLLNKLSSDKIIEKVSSKGGATERGMRYFKENKLREIIHNSADLSLERIKNISKQLK